MNIEQVLNTICEKLNKDDGVGNKLQLTETVAWLLFLKCVDLEEKVLTEQSEIGGEEYFSVIPDEYQWDNWAGLKSELSGNELLGFLSNKLIPSLSKMEGESDLTQLIKSIFQNVALYPKSGYRIRDCVEILNNNIKNDKLDKESLADAFDKFLRQMTVDNNKEHPRLFTPRPLCFLLVKLLNPQIRKKIYDPACGTSGFLIASHEFLSSKANTPKKLKTLKEDTLYGMEKRDLQYMLGVINCYFHGISRLNIIRGNALSINLAQIGNEDKYDVIVCNPTFDSDEGTMVQSNFSIPTGSVELMFLQHIEKTLKNGGKAAVILPEGVFFNTGSSYQEVKERLFEKCNVHSIISLPQIGVKTSILLFDKKGSTKDIWMYKFIISERVKLTRKSGYKVEYFDDLLKKFTDRKESENSKLVEKSEIISKEYNMSVSAYIEDSQEETELLEPYEYLEEMDNLLDQSKTKVSELKKELRE